LRDLAFVDLLNGDIEFVLRSVDEIDDDLSEIVRRLKLGRARIELDLPDLDGYSAPPLRPRASGKHFKATAR
jgi:hypothetical protein